MASDSVGEIVAECRITFALEIRRRREAQGWTQADLAARAGLHNTTVSQCESAQAPGFRTLARFALAFGCEPHELLKPSPGTSEEVERGLES